nr:2-amino-4-hydroxy-6-hydroxymethyldihydropteridine diphosphokinase [Thalassorhabdomicrobium marinisediminis]
MPQGQDSQGSNIVLVALGGNAPSRAGSPRATVEAAIFTLREIFSDFKASSLYQTPAFPAGAGPDFVNAGAVFRSDLDATEILELLHGVEAEFGRERVARWGQRTLDLDLVACGEVVLPDRATFQHWSDLPLEAQKTATPDRLILPHPRLADRAFVLVPLAELVPDWTHPVTGQTIAQMLDARPEAERDSVTTLT